MVHPAFRGMVKLGHTNDLSRRLSDANTWCPGNGYRIVWAASLKRPAAVESAAHGLLAEARRGGEWFYTTPVTAQAAVEWAVARLEPGA